jgi:hypothetical protein
MAIVYKNGRLIRETGGSGDSGGFTAQDIADALEIAANQKPKGIDLGKSQNPEVLTPEQRAVVGNTGPLTQAQKNISRDFQKNAAAEGAARLLAVKNGEKERTAWGKKDNDGDGVPNAIDTTPDGDKPPPTPTGGSQNGNKNVANKTPMKSYIDSQLRMAGLPDTPSNRAKLRDEYMKIQATEQADTIKADEAAAQVAQDAKDAKAAFDAIMKSVGAYETNAGTAKTDAMQRLADLYDPQEADLGTQKQEQLNFLQKVLGQAGTDINTSETNFLANIKNPSAYTDVPLTSLPQQQNALLEALKSQGAGTGEVQAQSNLDASLNDFMKQLSERSAQQYGNAQTNYVDALRNAGMGAAKSGRDYLALEQPRLQSGINSKYADALAELKTNRASSESDIMTQFQQALADAQNVKVDAETKYPQPVATPATPATPADAVDELGMTEEDRKKLADSLAMFNFGGYGFGQR